MNVRDQIISKCNQIDRAIQQTLEANQARSELEKLTCLIECLTALKEKNEVEFNQHELDFIEQIKDIHRGLSNSPHRECINFYTREINKLVALIWHNPESELAAKMDQLNQLYLGTAYFDDIRQEDIMTNSIRGGVISCIVQAGAVIGAIIGGVLGAVAAIFLSPTGPVAVGVFYGSLLGGAVLGAAIFGAGTALLSRYTFLKPKFLAEELVDNMTINVLDAAKNAFPTLA